MNRRPNRYDDPASHAMKQGNRFNDALDDYTPVREVYLRKSTMDTLAKGPPKIDRDVYRCEDYLRNKWGCTDAMPDSFDPVKLDAALRARLPAKNRRQQRGKTGKEAPGPVVQPPGNNLVTMLRGPQDTPLQDAYGRSPDDFYLSGSNASHESLSAKSANRILDTGETAEGYESDACTSDDDIPTENISHTRARSNSSTSSRRGRTAPGAPERASSPRIRSGSKPPLSRSAYVEGGVPCLDEKCQGACKRGVVVRGRSRPPPYFPFRSRGRRRRSSGSKSRRNSSSA
ncbi:hypothetical protein ANO14919_139880 [Xylariales sp. No.14919]|nr:hypothetical protein ANO14919_139880 [Xylariales sp. No.14919]